MHWKHWQMHYLVLNPVPLKTLWESQIGIELSTIFIMAYSIGMLSATYILATLTHSNVVSFSLLIKYTQNKTWFLTGLMQSTVSKWNQPQSNKHASKKPALLYVYSNSRRKYKITLLTRLSNFLFWLGCTLSGIRNEQKSETFKKKTDGNSK